MIDAHCHIDMYQNPMQIIDESEKLGIVTIGVTNLPSHFEVGYPRVLQCKRVCLALGMHPLLAESHDQELPKFVQNLNRTSYIGEIGLDFSREGISTKETQIKTFRKILSLISDNPKLLSIHSRKAERDVLEYLVQSRIKSAVFHWYSGPLKLIESITDAGYLFSVTPAMLASRHGQEIINKIPRTHLLTESDGPFARLNGTAMRPSDVNLVCSYLSRLWNVPEKTVDHQISENFDKLLSQTR